MRHLIKKILKEHEDSLEWAQDAIRDAPNLELGQKVIITNRGNYYPTHTEAMLELGIPGMKEFLETYGRHWWESIPFDFEERFDMNTWDIMDEHQKWLYYKIPTLGIPNNGDICYIIGEPLADSEDDYYWLYRLYRESDGKQFVMDRGGFEFVNENLREQEDDLEWAGWDSHSVEVGDLFEISAGYKVPFYVRVTKMDCYEEEKGRKIDRHQITSYDIIHDGCWAWIERSDDTNKWIDAGRVERKWVNHLINIGYWKPINSFKNTENIFTNLTESEDDLEWAQDIVNNIKHNVKWIRTDDGKRFKNMSSKGKGDIGWSHFRGWDNWYWVNSVEVVDGVLCYITSLGTSPTTLNRLAKYFTPVEDYNNEEISLNDTRPRVGNEKKID